MAYVRLVCPTYQHLENCLHPTGYKYCAICGAEMVPHVDGWPAFEGQLKVESLEAAIQRGATMEAAIQKGSRVRAEWFEIDIDNTCLSGAQMKAAAVGHLIIGTVRHIRSDDPEFKPENCWIFVEPEDGSGTMHCQKCGVKEVKIRVAWIREVISL